MTEGDMAMSSSVARTGSASIPTTKWPIRKGPLQDPIGFWGAASDTGRGAIVAAPVASGVRRTAGSGTLVFVFVRRLEQKHNSNQEGGDSVL